MKRIIPYIILLLLSFLAFYKRDVLFNVYKTYVVESESKKITSPTKNDYYRNYDFRYVQNVEDYIPENKQDLLNIIYSIINSGTSEFTFYCPVDYKECISDVESIASNQVLLSDINNYVHPYNSFKHVEITYDDLNRVTLTIEKGYKQEEINQINTKVEEVFNQLYNPNTTDYNNIKVFHDYIINNTKYDSNRSDNNIINYKSDSAYGPLLEGYALCGGYSDAMELFLEKLNIESFKVSSEKHVWNAVYLNGTWYHLDLTWDDPVTNTGAQLLLHDYFLIDTNKLKSLKIDQHNYDELAYQELK